MSENIVIRNFKQSDQNEVLRILQGSSSDVHSEEELEKQTRESAQLVIMFLLSGEN